MFRITKYIIVFLIISLHWHLKLYAQQSSEKSLFEQNLRIIKEVEDNLEVIFYYQAEWLKKVKLNPPVSTGSTESVLNSVLSESGLNYHIYQKNKIILTMNEKLDLSESMAGLSIATGQQSDQIERKDQKLEARKIHTIGRPGNPDREVLLSGKIREILTGQALEGVEIFVDEGKYGVTTDINGQYAIKLPNGYHVVEYRYLGFKKTKRHVKLYSDGKMNVLLEQEPMNIDQVYVVAQRNREEREMVGFEKLEMKELEELPSFMGEPDIIKQSLLMPGIQSAGEADMSFSVRGGKGDQNLILIDGMQTYSHSHFFGFFPGINPGTIEDANLYKAGIPVQFGNRISSVYDISTKKGSNENLHMDGGFSLVNGNLMVSGPLVKDKLTVVASGRMTYSGWLLKNLKNIDQLEYSEAGFYDYQLKLNYQPNEKSSVSFLFYNSNDDFTLRKDMTYTFNNMLGSINWEYQLDKTKKIKTIAGFSSYQSNIDNISTVELSTHKNQTITDFKLSSFLDYRINKKHHIISGIDLVFHQIKPWNLEKGHKNSLIVPASLGNQQAMEGSIFISDEFQLSPRFKMNAGIRYTTYGLIGEHTEFIYHNNITTPENLYDTLQYEANDLAYFDAGLELNFSGSYQVRTNQHFNFGFNRNRQYIHLLTNSQGMTPTDSWQLTNSYIPPQIGTQFSFGYNVDFNRNMYMTSVDVYYKYITNFKDFVNGSKFELNPHPETELVNAEGKSYGAEFMVRKNKGRVSGWISYTYSRSLIRSASAIESKVVNDGKYYPASYDKPHNLSVVLNLKPTRRLTLSNTVNFSSGVPITLPISKIKFGDSYSVIYSDRNEYRVPNYFRYDVSLTYKGSLKKDKLVSGKWIFSIYNVTGRMNPYSIYYQTNNARIEGYKLSIFGKPIPTITYKFSF